MFWVSFQAFALDLKTCSEDGYMSEVMDDMHWYRVNNSSFHRGDDVYDHSAWSARAMEQWFEEGHPWVKGIPANLKDAAILGAFLHDIGKTGDLDLKIMLYPGWKVPHPEIGFDFTIGKKDYYTIKGNKKALATLEEVDLKSLQPKGSSERDGHGNWISVPMTKELTDFIVNLEDAAKGGKATLVANAQKRDFNQLLHSCPTLTAQEAAMIKISIGMHYNWGNFIADRPTDPPEIGYQKYVDALVQQIKDSNSQQHFVTTGKISQLVSFCIAVANADFKGSQKVYFNSKRFPAVNENDNTKNLQLDPTPYVRWNGDGNYEKFKVPFMAWLKDKERAIISSFK